MALWFADTPSSSCGVSALLPWVFGLLMTPIVTFRPRLLSLSGKISDVVGLVCQELVLNGGVNHLHWRRHSHRRAVTPALLSFIGPGNVRCCSRRRFDNVCKLHEISVGAGSHCA